MDNPDRSNALNLSPVLFWDVDPRKIDFDKRASYVIERVLTHGILSDWIIMKNYYGDEKIKEVGLNARWLDDKTLHFLSNHYNIPLTDFRCYILRQSIPQHYPY